jgi:hypothetical protein
MSASESLLHLSADAQAELANRSLMIAVKLLQREHERHHNLTPSEVVLQAYDEILNGLHDAEYDGGTPGRLLRLVMTKIVLETRSKRLPALV